MSEHFLYIVTKISLSLADIVKQSHCILKDRVHVQFLGYKHVYVWGFFNFMLQNQSGAKHRQNWNGLTADLLKIYIRTNI